MGIGSPTEPSGNSLASHMDRPGQFCSAPPGVTDGLKGQLIRSPLCSICVLRPRRLSARTPCSLGSTVHHTGSMRASESGQTVLLPHLTRLPFPLCRGCGGGSVWARNSLFRTRASWWDRSSSCPRHPLASRQTSPHCRAFLGRDENAHRASHLPCSFIHEAKETGASTSLCCLALP